MRTKVLICIKGGNLTYLASNKDIDFVIVDWDNLESGDKPERLYIASGDDIKDDLYTSFNKEDKKERPVYKRLKKLKF